MNRLLAEVNVIIADDHGTLAVCLKEYLQKNGFEYTTSVSNGSELLVLMKLRPADVVLLDIEMPGMSGLEALEILHQKYPDTKVIMFSRHDEAHYIMEARRLHARGYICKTAPPDQIISSIAQVLDGKTFYSHGLSDNVMDFNLTCERFKLSEKDKLIIPGLVAGRSAREDGLLLHVPKRTIDGWRGKLRKKMGAKNSKDLIRILVKEGLA